MQPLRESVERLVCDEADRIRIELVVAEGVPESCELEQDGREVVAHCFVDAAKYKALQSPGRAEFLAEAAEKTLTRIISHLHCA